MIFVYARDNWNTVKDGAALFRITLFFELIYIIILFRSYKLYF